MRIPDEKIEEVRSATDIVDLISATVPLKKRGKSYLGRCPFHQEKTPSFSVSPDKQMYYCFGCSAGGNVFTYVMATEKVSFIEAVRSLAERAGITIPEERADKPLTEYEELFDACRRAGRFYHEQLSATPEGRGALDYFHRRGFQEDTIRQFGLGYSPASWDGLVRFAEAEKISVHTMVRAGLLLQREDKSGLYDRFRGRAMFPIFSPSGRVIAFGARKLREDDPLGKYINSPETPIYEKSRVLYGLSHARDSIRERGSAILVEGYADLISVYQAGTRNIVASSGTALTEDQIRLVGRYAKEIVLVYDGDSAGSRAMVRGVDLVVEQGLDVRVAVLPAGEDPDSFVRKHGGAAFEELVKKGVSFLDFKAQTFRDAGMLQTPEGKTRAVRSMVETLARMKDELKRTFYVKALAEKYDLYESVLHKELERALERQRPSPGPAPYARPTSGGPPREQGDVPPAPPLTLPPAERDLLTVMLDHGADMVKFVFSQLSPEQFTHSVGRTLVDLLRALTEQNPAWDANHLVDSVDDDAVRQLIVRLVFTRQELSPEWQRMGSDPNHADPYTMATDAIRTVLVGQIDQRIRELHRALKEAQGQGEDGQTIMGEILALQQEKKRIQSRRVESSPESSPPGQESDGE